LKRGGPWEKNLVNPPPIPTLGVVESRTSTVQPQLERGSPSEDAVPMGSTAKAPYVEVMG